MSAEMSGKALNTMLVKPLYRDTIINGKLSGILAFLSWIFWITAAVYALALADDGTVWQWGNMHYELHSQQGNDSVPIHQVPISNVTAIAAGAEDSYALKSDGTVWAWGSS